jgi:deazaflavin-dependent oxidoreductase (nitroreductase family)
MANWQMFTRAHCAVYRGTRGLIGANLIGIHMLLLTTRGRQTGRERTLPLAYVEHEDDFVIVASNGGSPTAPAWWLNLRAAETAQVQVGAERFTATWQKRCRASSAWNTGEGSRPRSRPTAGTASAPIVKFRSYC